MLGKPLVRFREGRGGNWALVLEAPRLLDPAVRPGYQYRRNRAPKVRHKIQLRQNWISKG
jgi:hypothetical protein